MFHAAGRIALAGVLSAMAVGLCSAGAYGQDRPEARDAKHDLYGDPLPPGSLARLGTIRFRHDNNSFALPGLCWLPDGKTVVTAVEGRSIQFWEAETGKPLREFRTDPMTIRAFALSQDGSRLAVAGFWTPDPLSETKGEIRVLDAQTGEQIQTLSRDSTDVDRLSLAFTHDGKLLVSLGLKGVLRIEDIATRTEILTQAFPRDNSASLAVSPDGTKIAVQTGANTEKFCLWSWQAGEEPRELKTVGEPNGGGNLAFSPDGKWLAWVNHGSDPIHIWDATDGVLAKRLFPPNVDEYFESGIVFTPDGKHLLASTAVKREGSVHVWNATDWRHERQLEIAAGRFAVSPDSKRVFTGRQVFNLQSGEELGAIPDAHRSLVLRVETAPQGHVVTASDDNTIRVWNQATGRQLLRLAHDGWIRDIAVSPDGSMLVSSSLDDTVRLWDLTTGREIYRLPGHGNMGGRRAVRFCEDGEHFWSFGDDFYLRKYEIRRGKALVEHKIQPTGVEIPSEDRDRDAFDSFYVEQAVITPDGQSLVVGLNRKLFVFNTATGQERTVLEHEGGHMLSLAFSPDSRRMLLCAWGKPVSIELPDGRTRYSAAANHTATLWNLETGKVEATILFPEGSIGPCVFSPYGSRFAVANREVPGKVSVYLLDGTLDAVLPNVPRRITAVAFGDDGQTLITALADTTAVVWAPQSLVEPPPP